MGLKDVINSLLGISAYQPPANGNLLPQLGDATVDEIREAMGGNLQPMPTTRLRWYLADLEAAQISADTGFLRPAAQLYKAMRRDGTVNGLLGTRSGGLIRLPVRFYGDKEVTDTFERRNNSRSVWEEMLPPNELEAIAADGQVLNIAVGELQPVKGRAYPVLVRLDPEYLQYRWTENRWYFQSVAGLLPITPGDGRWVLHMPGPRMAPWPTALWPALGRSFINKEHAMSHRSNYSGKLANPARLAYAPAAATEAQRIGFFRRLLAWGMNTVLELPPGYEAKLLESNGRGFEVFQKEIDTSDQEIMVALAGQVVTTTGGTGFANADIHKTIREDLIKRDGDALAYTINTQIIPQYVANRWGVAAITEKATWAEWDTTTPKELEAQSRTLLTFAQALTQLAATLEGSGREINVDELATRFGLPLTGDGVAKLKSQIQNKQLGSGVEK